MARHAQDCRPVPVGLPLTQLWTYFLSAPLVTRTCCRNLPPRWAQDKKGHLVSVWRKPGPWWLLLEATVPRGSHLLLDETSPPRRMEQSN